MKIIAHRAKDHHDYLENTKEAIIECLKQNYIDGIEIDVRMTKDKKIVLNHNMTIDLVSNGSGFVHNLTLKELKHHTFGYNQKISELEDVLNNIDTKKEILIEIKEERKEWKDTVEKVCKIVKKHPNKNIFLCSFNYDLLEYIKQKQKYKTILLIGLTMNTNRIYNHFTHNALSMNYLKFGHQQDYIWTINKLEEVKKIQKKDYSLNIITDNAYLLKVEFEKQQKKEYNKNK